MSNDSSGTLGIFANHIIKVVVVGIGCVCSVIIGMQITDANSNGLANFAKWLCAVFFVASVMSPRTGIYLVLCISPFLDLIKRSLVLFDSLDLSQVSIVLALAPVTMVGAVLGTFGLRLLQKEKIFKPGEGQLFFILVALTAIIVGVNVLHNTESKLSMLKDVAEICAYLPLIILVPIHFPGTDDVAKLFRTLLLLFVPVALYGFWQYVFGLSRFEYTYLASGLTIMADDYYINGRIFSTLSSNHAFSVSMACCAIIALLVRRLPAETRTATAIRKITPILALIFTAACLLSFRRTGWLVIVLTIAGAYCFRSPVRTLSFYASCVAAFFAIVLNSQFIMEKLPAWESQLRVVIPDVDQGTALQTFNDRLYSFQNLTSERGMWSLFGLPADQQQLYFVHDAVSQALVGYGVFGLCMFLGIMVFALKIAHQAVWRSRDPRERGYAAMLTSFAFCNVFIGAIMQNHIGIYPVNFIFWLCVGALMNVTFAKELSAQATAYAARFVHRRHRRISLPGAEAAFPGMVGRQPGRRTA